MNERMNDWVVDVTNTVNLRPVPGFPDPPGCQRNRLPSGVDGLHCGDGLCQRPQGHGWDQRGRLARAAL